jgi:RNA polymerase sigma factor (sigma-70 family)
MLKSLEGMETRHDGVAIGEVVDLLGSDAPRGWRLFVEKYSRFVYSVSLKFSGGLDDPEEFAAELYRRVFVRLEARDFALIRGFRGQCEFRTYLYRVIQTERFRLFRRRGVERGGKDILEREALLSVEAPKGDSLDPGKSPLPDWNHGVGRKAAREALEALGEEDRRILTLRFAGGLKLRELAEVLGARDTNDAAYRLRKALGRCRALTTARSSPEWDESAFHGAADQFREALFAANGIQNAGEEVSDHGEQGKDHQP